MIKISIVTSLYKSSPYVGEFYNRCLESIKKIQVDYEFIFVNDGSPDDSANKVLEIAAFDKKVILVDLSRNFGQYPAMFAGLNYARGDYVFTIDVDLEEEPENILIFYNALTSDQSLDVVYGIVEKRSGGIIRDNLGKIFHDIMDKLTDEKIVRDLSWVRLMKIEVVKSLIKFREAETYVSGLHYLVGFKQHPLIVKKIYKGNTTYTFAKRVKSALDAVTSFSSKPLFFISIFGALISLISLSFLIILVVSKLFGSYYQLGWSSIIISIWLVGGMNLFSMGIIGIYLSKIFIQVKNRPLYIVKSITNYEI